jgi:rhamnose utilization protein RhaD (predicted bifunctional aldolase and dehydrogenase)
MNKVPDLTNLLFLSKYLTNRIDYIQGAGGNISEKIDDEVMVIKSSGVEIKEINQKDGYSLVRHKIISGEFSKLPLEISKEQDETTVSFINNQIINLPNYKSLRPSIETGFHSILKKYVIHTHSVYCNIISCSNSFEDLTKKLFKQDNFINVKYFPPGTILTRNILHEYNNFYQRSKKYPGIIFLKNHGIIVHAETSKTAIEIHEYVTKKLCDYFKLNTSDFPTVFLNEKTSSNFESYNKFLLNYFENKKIINQDYFNETLFPDQTVYFKDNISFDNNKNKKVIIKKDRIIYNTNFKEAKTIEETLIAYVFIRKQIELSNLQCSFISKKEMNYIHDLESEKYRKKMLKK